MINDDSILDTTKKLLGFEPDYTAFDRDIITHINSVFYTLHSIGVGPPAGFAILDNQSTWTSFTDFTNLYAVKSYVYLKVRLLFDPPTSSFHLESLKTQAAEFEWRLHVQAEGVKYALTETTTETPS